jgi:hypothetical protein
MLMVPPKDLKWVSSTCLMNTNRLDPQAREM